MGIKKNTIYLAIFLVSTQLGSISRAASKPFDSCMITYNIPTDLLDIAPEINNPITTLMIGQSFFDALVDSKLTCRELQRLKQNYYENHLKNWESDYNLYYSFLKKINKQMDIINDAEKKLDELSDNYSDDDWNTVITSFLSYASVVNIGVVLGAAKTLSAGGKILFSSSAIGVIYSFYSIAKDCKNEKNRRSILSLIKNLIRGQRLLVNFLHDDLDSKKYADLPEAITTFNAFCDIIKKNCMPPEEPRGLGY